MINNTDLKRMRAAVGQMCSTCRSKKAETKVTDSKGRWRWSCQSCAERRTKTSWSGPRR